MALTQTEARAVNTLLSWLLGIDTGRVDWPPMAGEAREAAELLADHANVALMAGLTRDQVHEAWANLTAAAVLTAGAALAADTQAPVGGVNTASNPVMDGHDDSTGLVPGPPGVEPSRTSAADGPKPPPGPPPAPRSPARAEQ